MKSMQPKSTIFGVTYKSELPETSQQRRNRKEGLVTIPICLPPAFFKAPNLGYLIIPMPCPPISGDWKLISSLGTSDYLKACLFMLKQILSLPASTYWSWPPFWSQREWPSFLLHGDSPRATRWHHHHRCSDVLSIAICQVSFCTQLTYYLHNNLGSQLLWLSALYIWGHWDTQVVK